MFIFQLAREGQCVHTGRQRATHVAKKAHATGESGDKHSIFGLNAHMGGHLFHGLNCAIRTCSVQRVFLKFRERLVDQRVRLRRPLQMKATAHARFAFAKIAQTPSEFGELYLGDITAIDRSGEFGMRLSEPCRRIKCSRGSSGVVAKALSGQKACRQGRTRQQATCITQVHESAGECV